MASSAFGGDWNGGDDIGNYDGSTSLGEFGYSGDGGSDSDSRSSPGPKTFTTVIVGVASQTFRITCWGLKPSTNHKAYLIDRDVSADCAPVMSGVAHTYGGTLKSDASGNLVFDYAFKPENSPFDKKVLSNKQTVAIIPAGKQKFRVTSSDGNSSAESFIESKKST